MPGLVFDGGEEPDPQTPLVGWFDAWVATLVARRAAKTASGYVADAAKFTDALAATVRRNPPTCEQEHNTTGAVDPWVETMVGRGVGRRSLLRARSWCTVLLLADLAPRNLATVLDQIDGADATVRRIASSWSSFCQFLVRREVLAANPMHAPAIDRPAAPQAAPSPLSAREVSRLLLVTTTPDRTARAPWPTRDTALAATLLATGIRSAEVIGAKVGDLEALETAPRLRVTGKGAKTRVLPVYPEAAERVRTYLAERQRDLADVTDDAPLFVRADGSAFTSSALRRLVERWYVRAGVRRHQGASVHALRHTWATTALDAGASIVEVQTALGHASLETTRRYLEVVGAGLDETMAAHPSRQALRALTHRPDLDL